MTERMIWDIYNGLKQGSTAKDLAEALSKVWEVQNALAGIKAEQDSACSRYRLLMEEFDNRRIMVQACCPHHLVEKQSDPSGGSDSCRTCKVCGKEL